MGTKPAFVGRTAGVAGLAALSPATICTDQMLYLFSFLSRATTGLVSRAFGVKGDKQAARESASAPLTVAIVSGVLLSALYAIYTPTLLSALNVDSSIVPMAASYIYIRGAVASAALAQAVALSVLLATKDALTPLKCVALAAGLNVIGDFAFCVWPLRWGTTGASLATALATLVSAGSMVKSLRKKQLLPSIRRPSWAQCKELLLFTGPLFAITLTRLGGYINMQRRAMTFGVKPLAAYQLAVNLMMFFVLFGEPLSQLFQTKLPALMNDEKNRPAILSNFRSVFKFSCLTSVSVATVAGLALYFGAPCFTADTAVQALAQEAAPSLFLAVMATIFGITMDGALLASRDFGYILTVGVRIHLKIVLHCCYIPTHDNFSVLRLVLI
jgi:Na+-driven multidrug efflux pump